MYPEFIAIYVMLAIVIGMLGVVLFFLFKLMKNGTSNNKSSYVPVQPPVQQEVEQYYGQQYQVPYQEAYPQQGVGIVFCKQCATQFDSSQGYCPRCGTRR